jgi:hypothetical protein
MNDPKNPYLSRLYAVEDQIVIDRKHSDVRAQVRFKAFADVRELANIPNLSAIELTN